MNKIQLNERYCIDIGVKVSGNEKGAKRLTMEKVFKSLNLPRAWKKVKKGDAVIIRTGMNGKDVDVAKIEYFNPNVVQIIARGGSTNLVDLENVGLMVPKIANEGYRSYKDSVDVMDNYSKYVEVQSKIDNVSFKFKPLVNELISIGMKKSAAALKGIVNSINDGDFARLMSKEKKEVIGK